MPIYLYIKINNIKIIILINNEYIKFEVQQK